MDKENSRAALAAIAALQKQIKMLEDENCLLEEEYNSVSKQISERKAKFEERETTLNTARSNAKQMLHNTNLSIQKISGERDENQRLKDHIDEMDNAIKEEVIKQKKLKIMNRKLKSSLNDIMEKNEEYESIIFDIIAPPPISTHLLENEIILVQYSENDPKLLPSPLSEILETMQKLPKLYCLQNPDTKKEIINVVYHAKEAATEIRSKISHLEKRKFSSCSPRKFDSQIHKLSVQLLILSNEMKKFQFPQ
ncbi:hypothetical protein TRFO_04330 [Tritrichomonas foetus]|uniref:Uncharacterized protein n=1 Tax=Tritrichomonas foetus TaxID=1144522 RepID=A0A1J4KLN8_9EUKA|nr:hypothetical protein TRFO_04330 [Tritrichomonas foetus]|eukprot:OHT10293.1 hypothetical protein TRFO_04330 [Tritrichomonas foetus]